MQVFSDVPLISCFLLKVASRCNINCDYCYMYNHLDQGWRLQPKLMSEITLQATAERISEYVAETGISRLSIVYHGGEPLLLGANKLIENADFLRRLLPEGTKVDFSIQTNGVLLREEDILRFEEKDIQISLSIDGPASAHDRHRLDHQGKSSFAATERALFLLEKHPAVFAGVIAVIDAKNDPIEILDFFGGYDIHQLDFLLPDANYLTPPPERAGNPNLYSSWLITCFDYWFDNFPSLKIRTFDTILGSLLGAPSETDGLGFGDVSLITIETDGSYHDLDVLKITGAGTNLMMGDVHSAPFKVALTANQIKEHRRLLKKEGISEVCQTCNFVEVCGGGAVGHRFGANGFKNPSIYCHELKELIQHAKQRVEEQLSQEFEQQGLQVKTFVTDAFIEEFEMTPGLSDSLMKVFNEFETFQSEVFNKVIFSIDSLKDNPVSQFSSSSLRRLSTRPSIVAWTDVMLKHFSGISVKDIDGNVIYPDSSYYFRVISNIGGEFLSDNWPQIHRTDSWLRIPFGTKIHFEDSSQVKGGQRLVNKAISLINAWNPSIIEEMRLISPEIQFIRDTSAHPDKIVSFSDNSVPGALYIQIVGPNGLIDIHDLADSIIHEHRHQRLYLFQRVCPVVYSDFPLVASPWREEMRPPSGLYHAIYVFVELLDFWEFIRVTAQGDMSQRAERECLRIKQQLQKGFETVRSCNLTKEGFELLNQLYLKYAFLTNET